MELNLFFGIRAGSCIGIAFVCFTQSLLLNGRANQWLSLFFVILTVLFAEDFADAFPIINTCIPAYVDLSLLLPVVLCTSTYCFTHPEAAFKQQLLYLAAPFIVGGLLEWWVSFYQQPLPFTDANSVNWLLLLLYAGSWTSAFVFCENTLRRYQSNVERLSAPTERVNLRWLYRIVLVIPLMVTCGALIMFIDVPGWVDNLSDVILFLALLYVLFYKLQEEDAYFFKDVQLAGISEVVSLLPPPPLLKSDEKEVLVKRLTTLMEEEKVFLSKTISLPRLANRLGIRSHQLSWLINTHYQENFYSFINSYRIEESKRALIDPAKSHISIQGIAYEVGFNSKTTFNTNFKNRVGVTPSEYQKSLR